MYHIPGSQNKNQQQQQQKKGGINYQKQAITWTHYAEITNPCLFWKLTVHLDRHNNKSKYGVLGHIMGHFTNFFRITEVGGENSVYGNVGSIYYRGVFHFKNNTCAYLIKATVLKLLIYVNP